MNPGNPSPMMTPPPPPPPGKGGFPWKWVLIGCGSVTFLGLLACGGCLFIGWNATKDIIAAAKSGDLQQGYDAEDKALADLIMGGELRAGIYAFNLVQKRGKRPAGAPDKSLARPVTKVGVVGAGLMASQMALLFLRRLEVPVALTDIDQERVDKGIAYVHVLQPNQYFTSRPFGPEESSVAINTASPFKPGVEQGYPALLAEAAAQSLGPRTGFFDATGIFDGEKAPVYVDNCCHYTRVGYLRLADFVARAVMSVGGPWRSR